MPGFTGGFRVVVMYVYFGKKYTMDLAFCP
jgi:hypothetical protein